MAGCAHRPRAGVDSFDLCGAAAAAPDRTVPGTRRTRPHPHADPDLADISRDAESPGDTPAHDGPAPLAERFTHARRDVHPRARCSTHAGAGAELVADPHTDTDTNAHPDTDTVTDAHTHSHTDTNAHTDADADADASSDSHAGPDADAETEALGTHPAGSSGKWPQSLYPRWVAGRGATAARRRRRPPRHPVSATSGHAVQPATREAPAS